MSENFITISVVGMESESGHVRVDEFLEELSSLLITLNGIDRLVGDTGKPTLYYRIVSAHHNGAPLAVTLEPIVRRTVARPDIDHIEKRHNRFFQELEAISQNKPISPDVDEQILENLRDLSATADNAFKAVTISNGESRVALDTTFEQNLLKLLREEDTSYGHVEGSLDVANIHGHARRFWIYPRLGPAKIRCDFLPGTADQIKDALGQYVRVEGVKYFRPHSPYPFRVKVKDFEIVPDRSESHLKHLGGVEKNATGEMSSVDFVRAIRDEWD